MCLLMLNFFSWIAYSQTEKYWFYYRGQIQVHPYTFAQILEKNMLVYHPSRPQWCLTDVSSNDREASAGEADFSRILSGAFVYSAHQTRHQCRAREEATKQIHRGERKNAVVVAFGQPSVESAYSVETLQGNTDHIWRRKPDWLHILFFSVLWSSSKILQNVLLLWCSVSMFFVQMVHHRSLLSL